MLSQIKIGSLFLMNPTIIPPKDPKPREEDYTDVKILYFYPRDTDINEQRKQSQISEGIVNFFMPFSGSDAPIECIATNKYTHVVQQVEKDLWLNVVITHPEELYGCNRG